MNPLTRRRGFTLTEMLVVIAIIGILAALLLPAIARSQLRAKRIWCINNLHEVGVGFQMFAHDHDSRFPMEVPMAQGGSQEFVQNGYNAGAQFYFAYRHFQALSNEISEARILVCPTDTREAARSVSSLQNSNVSYFVGVYADYGKPVSILAGDRNIESISGTATILTGTTGSQLRWTKEMHQFKGNILFADAHVEQWNTVEFPAGGGPGNREDFFLPTVPGQNGNSSGGNYRPVSPPSYSPPRNTPSPSPSPNPQNASPPQNSMSGSVNNQFSRREISGARAEITLTNSSASKTNSISANIVAPKTTNQIETMSEFHQRLAKTLQYSFEWFYILLLILILLILLYWLLRQSRKRKQKRQRQPPE